jgi:hypothetical protein
MEWITGVVVPIGLGLLAAFGATWYSNRKNDRRLQQEANDRAADAVRGLIRALRDTSDDLEARAMKVGGWDPTKDVINHGGQDAVRAAFTEAAPYFHRLRVLTTDNKPLRNEFPDYGSDPMAGSESFHERAEQIQAVLDRGLI